MMDIGRCDIEAFNSNIKNNKDDQTIAVPGRILYAQNLSNDAKLLFVTISRQSNNCPSNNQIRKMTGLSKWKLDKARNELIAHHIIRYHKGGSPKNGQRIRSSYEILPENDWILVESTSSLPTTVSSS